MAAALVAVTLSMAPPAPTQAAGRPDLVVRAVRPSSGSVLAGHAITVHDMTKNVGAAPARSSTTAYFLSADQRKSSGDRRLGSRKPGRLAAGARDAGSTKLMVPAATPARAYWLIACADAQARVAESKEQNNCRASASKLTVRSVGIFPQTPNPAPPVTATADTGSSSVVTGTYNPATGLDLYGYDSSFATTYHLHLPGDLGTDNAGAALQGGEDVTMTVLSSAAGLPDGSSMLAGVRLEPEGLQLVNPGTLTITGPALTSANLASQTGAVWNSGGTDLSMSPILPPSQGGSPDAGSAVLSLSHFSSPSVLEASEAARQYLRDHPPARVLEQLQAKAADLLRTERLSQMAGHSADPAVVQDVQALYDDYFDHEVVPELNAALTDDTMANTALQDALRWERSTMLRGGDPGARGDLITAMLPKIMENAISKAWSRCAVDHHLSDIMTLLGIARWAAVLGDQTDAGEAYDKALACGHFVATVALDVHHSYHYPAHQVGTFSEDVEGHWATKQTTLDIGVVTSSATAPVSYDPAAESYSNVWKDYEGPPDCPVFVKQTDMTSTVDGTVRGLLFVDINAYEVPPGAQRPRVQPGSLALTFADAAESYHWYYTECGSGSGDSTFPGLQGYAQAAFTDGGSVYGDQAVKIPIDPAAQTGATLYDDVYERTWDNQAFLHEVDTAAVTLSVVHTPQPVS